MLNRAASVLPSDLQGTVVADRAFGCPAFLDPLVGRGWDYVVRVQGQTRLVQTDGTHVPIKSTVRAAGERWWGPGRVFKKQGWRAALAVAYWRVGCKEPLLLVSILSQALASVRLYRWRSAIESLFRDWKSYGWQWEASQVRQVAHQERLILVLALMTVLTLLLGCEAAQQVLAQPAQIGRRHHGRHATACLAWDVTDTPAHLDGEPDAVAQRVCATRHTDLVARVLVARCAARQASWCEEWSRLSLPLTVAQSYLFSLTVRP